MTSPKNAPKKPIEVGDLLRLKKAEAPDAAFWDLFDNELHQRMLQTLVRKEPWYVQAGRALGGRFAQSVAVASAAALLALVVVRPALVPVEHPQAARLASPDEVFVDAEAPARGESGLREVSMADFNTEVAKADYQIDMISASSGDSDVTYRRDFEMDTVQVASSEAADYSGDSAASWPMFGNTGVASLVY